MGLALAGVGFGVNGPGMQTSAIEAAGPMDVGAAAGLDSTSRYVGSITGSAALAALASGGVAGAGALSNLDAVFAMVLIAAVLSAVACLGLRDVRGE